MLLSFDYQYDGNGNRTAKTGIQGLTAGSSALQPATIDISYRYDVRGQLLEERRNNMSTHYAYDAAGNRIRKAEGEKATRYHYNAKNQLICEENSGGIKSFTYDRQGGIVEEKDQSGTRRFTYNSRHQQTQVENETGKVQKNRYDAEGLRYELIENGRRTSFVYHNGELLHEKEGKAETSYHMGAGIEAFQRDRKTYYYHQDEQLNTTLISDENASIKNHYQYDAFGAGLEAIEALPNRICYTGQQYDEQTGQYYLRARYYNPVLGLFMQDDVYQGDGLNLYAYCANNPVIYYDPSGFYRAKKLFEDEIANKKGKSSDLKKAIMKNLTGNQNVTGSGGYQAQHIIPNEMRKNPALAISGYQVDHAENGILDINRIRHDQSDLDNLIGSASEIRKRKYISNETQHGQNKGSAFHKAYNRYVELRLNELVEKYGINKMLDTKDMETIRKELRDSGKLRELRKDVMQLNHELRRANQTGIDLYLQNENNKWNMDYTNGGKLSEKDAMRKYLHDNFNYNATDEQLKSIGCS